MMKSVSQLVHTLALSALLANTGCATLFGDNDRQLTITSDKPAEISYKGYLLGLTPATISVNHFDIYNPGMVSCSATGYKTLSAQIQTEFQPVSLLNLFTLAFFPVAVAIDAFTGNFFKLKHPSLHFKMLAEDAS